MKRILVMLLCLAMILTLASCVGGGEENSGADKEGGLAAEKGKTVSFMLPVFDYNDAELMENKVLKSFEETYPDVKLERISASIENWYTKLRAAAASGSPIDVFQDSANNNPMYALQGLNQPLQDYIDMESPNLHMTTMNEVFCYNGNYHVATTGPSVCVIYYNKDIFADEGIEDPMETYKAGNWNFDTFIRVAKQLTWNDSEGKCYGLACNYPYIFFGANATSMVSLNEKYEYTLNITDPNLAHSLQIIQDGWYTSKWEGWDGSPWSTFYNGNAAMLADFQWVEEQIIEAKGYGLCDFEYGVVPMAKGPNNPDGKAPMTAYGYSMGNGCDAPYHAGKLIDMLMDGEAKQNLEYNKIIPQAHQEVYAELAEKPFCVNSYDSAVGGAFEICQAIGVGQSIPQAIADFTPIYEQKVKEANSATAPELPSEEASEG
ncbi:MAG: extracellular solute-binding protein [Oscillospiraceae bacterium]|nr:extracellular solute-binding protein [Oscillospiraceae bacterium]